MNRKMFRIVFEPLSKWAAHRALVGRNRSRQQPEQGRFTTAEVRALLSQIWHTIYEITPSTIQEPTFGSRMNIRLAA